MNRAAQGVMQMDELTDIERQLAALEKRLTALEKRDADQLKRIEDKIEEIVAHFGVGKNRLAPCQIEEMAKRDVQEFLQKQARKKQRGRDNPKAAKKTKK